MQSRARHGRIIGIMLSTRQKTKIIEKSRVHEKDTGSTEVQLSLVSQEIARLADHLKQHSKDNHSRRGLLGMVARRKKLLDYLRGKDPKRYVLAVKKLGLKR